MIKIRTLALIGFGKDKWHHASFFYFLTLKSSTKKETPDRRSATRLRTHGGDKNNDDADVEYCKDCKSYKKGGQPTDQKPAEGAKVDTIGVQDHK